MAALGPVIPDRRGGWWHEYVCPTHGTQLLPCVVEGEYPCPHGCVLTGEPYAGAWVVLAHQAAARSLRALAVSPEPGAAQACLAGLTRYAELYRELGTSIRTDAQGWMLAGRMFQQALTEAIWGTSIALAVRTLAGSVPADRLRPVVPLLEALRSGASEARDVLLARDDFRNNYTAWLNVCGASTSRALALLGAPDLTSGWLAGPHGVEAHVAAAVHPDGWEWEGSTYYHVFVLRAYLLALGSEPVPGPLADRLISMVDVVAALATDRGGVLPALNDTPYGDAGWDEELYELCLLAPALPGAPDLGFLAAPLAARLPAEVVRWRRAESGAGLPAGAVARRESGARPRSPFALHTDTHQPSSGSTPPPTGSITAASDGQGDASAYAEQSGARSAPGGSGSGTTGGIGAASTSFSDITSTSDTAGTSDIDTANTSDISTGTTGGAGTRGSRLFADAGYAVLVGDEYRAILDLGPHGGSHGHLDKLALYLYGSSAPWLPAYGVPPYGHPWRRGYYRATAAHPTLTVDGADQAEAAGRLLYWRCADGRAEVGAAAGVFDGVRFERHVRAEPEWLLDVVRVTADRERDLTLHLRTDVEVTVRPGPGGARTRWAGDGGLVGRHVALPRTAVLTSAPDLGPADDPQRTRPHLRWLARSSEATFVSVYAPGGAAMPEPRLHRVGSVPVVEFDGENWTVPPAEPPSGRPETAVMPC